MRAVGFFSSPLKIHGNSIHRVIFPTIFVAKISRHRPEGCLICVCAVTFFNTLSDVVGVVYIFL